MATTDQDHDGRQVVEQFLRTFSTGDVDRTLEHLADDATWWVAGSLDGLSGTRDKDGIREMLGGAGGAARDGAIALTPTGWTVDGERVAVEVELGVGGDRLGDLVERRDDLAQARRIRAGGRGRRSGGAVGCCGVLGRDAGVHHGIVLSGLRRSHDAASVRSTVCSVASSKAGRGDTGDVTAPFVASHKGPGRAQRDVGAVRDHRDMDATQPTGTVGTPVDLPGIDPPAVEAWWAANVRTDGAPLVFDLIAGGRSNLTYRVTDAAGRAAILRRPPAGDVLESAHDVLREARIVGALVGSGVPVPTVLGVCADRAVTGAPFYVMDLVEGAVLHDVEAMIATFPAEDGRRRAAESLVDGLVRLHALDVDAVGLGDLGRRDGYIERQLRRWHRQWQASRGQDVPLVDELHDRLAARVPAQQRVSVVHGDYRLGNVIVGTDGELRAVLDWELCTLGDPLADLGYTLAWWASADDRRPHPLGPGPTSAPGVPSRVEVAERYAAGTGLDVAGIGFHVAFSFWKTACIMEGVRQRDLQARPDEAPPADVVLHLAERAAAALDGEL